jgi:GNAT superfamily N-acetyltransferase
MPVFADLELSQRLERTEAHANAMFVEARARLTPELRAAWIECGGAYAMFDGAESPLTQTFGLGLFEDATPEILDTLEAFFEERGAPVFHETSPLAGAGLAELLHRRGYRPMEFTSVLYRDISEVEAGSPEIHTRLIDPSIDGDVWAETMARGWAGEHPEYVDFLLELGKVNAARQDPLCFLAEIDRKPGAAAGLNIQEGTALFSGASTVPDLRRRGLQYALLAARMRFALEHGCDRAMMGALPGSASQRNAERHGFRIAYTRIKWELVPKD